MRVLYYNWVDYLDDEGRGGGVTVYQRNLMAAAKDAGIEAAQLSAGLSHDLLPGRPRWQRVLHGPRQDRDRRFEIVNSATLAPSHASFGEAAQVSHPETEQAVLDCLEATGPWDVVHFNNLEGLPAEVLRLKSRFPDTRVVLSWHNYYPVCPQVNLWRGEAAACDGVAGPGCRGCIGDPPSPRMIRLAYALAFRLKRAGIRPGTGLYRALYGGILRIGRPAARLAGRIATPRAAGRSVDDGDAFLHRQRRMVDLINAHVDVVHCVSDRAAAIAVSQGVSSSLIAVRRIGTPHAREWARTTPMPIPAEGPVRMAFLGYMRRDKGFDFLLEALMALPTKMSARIDLLIAARGGTEETRARLEALRPRLGALQVRNGYAAEEMSTLLADRHIGIVPPLWEDTLPQVALEMHARHVPLLVSDGGGAKELGCDPAFVFRAGDIDSFATRLQAIMDGRVDMAAYWQRARVPKSVAAHLEELLSLYSGHAGAGSDQPSGDEFGVLPRHGDGGVVDGIPTF